MKALIIEDEKAAVRNLMALLGEVDPDIEVIDVLDSITDSVEWFQSHPMPELIFLDIHLADGSAFEIFGHVDISCPIIFTTAYDEYALKAFKVNSVDYLLKPIDAAQFEQVVGTALDEIHHRQTAYLQLKGRSEIIRLAIDELIYAETERGHLLLHTPAKVLECYSTMEKLEQELKQEAFFRCHSSFLVALEAVRQIEKQDVVLKDGTRVPVSKNRKKGMKQALTNFWGGKFL